MIFLLEEDIIELSRKGGVHMRFVTIVKDNEQVVGLLNENCTKVIDLKKVQALQMGEVTFPSTLGECVTLGERFINEVQELANWVKDNEGVAENFTYDLDEVELLAPIPRPQKNIFCVGKNYAAHAIEMGSAADIPEHPMIFSKAPTTVTGPKAVVENHQQITNELDYEGEIAVIIGKTGKAIKKEDAYDYVFGYTLINDITARNLQRDHKQFLIGKSLDTSCPMGPWITHKNLIDNPDNLFLETKVNGEIRQAASTEQFIFDIPTIIETLSKGMTLEAGDIIATGTPAGVGSGFNPPKHLKPGDEIEIRVAELGVLTNTIAK